VDLVATEGWKLLPLYRFDPVTGLWRHRDGPVEPPFRLTDVGYDQATGELLLPDLPHDRAPESALEGYLEEARRTFSSTGGGGDDGVPDLGPDFEHLRWFELPAACVA
jgi:hypothetical protein